MGNAAFLCLHIVAFFSFYSYMLIIQLVFFLQICFDLGALYFYKGEYRKSYEKFRICKQIHNLVSIFSINLLMIIMVLFQIELLAWK